MYGAVLVPALSNSTDDVRKHCEVMVVARQIWFDNVTVEMVKYSLIPIKHLF